MRALEFISEDIINEYKKVPFGKRSDTPASKEASIVRTYLDSMEWTNDPEKSVTSTAKDFDISPEEVYKILKSARQRRYQVSN